MESFIIIIFIVGGIMIYFVQKANHESKIHNQIESLGGRVSSIERRTFSTGPFIMPGKGRTVYRIEYQVENEVKERWVKFGGLFGPDWRL